MAIDLRTGATQLVKWGSEPALATRVSIPNVNLLSTKGSILYGTGNYATGEASINGETYQYAEVKALEAPSGTEQFILSNNSDGNLRYVPVINDYTDYGSKLGVLSASVAYDINQKLHIANAAKGTGISMGDRASGINAGAIAIGNDANATAAFGEDGSFAIAIGSNARADNKNIAIGLKAIASSYAFPTIQLGTGENHTPKSFQVWDTPMLVNGKIPLSSLSPTITVDEKTGLVLSNGQSGKTMSYDGTVVLGPQAVAKGQEGIAIGAQAVASDNGIAIGSDAVYASSGGIAIGVGAVAGTEGIAIGNRAEAGKEVIQLGQFESKFSFRVGNFDVMGKDGQIPGQRLTTALSSIYQRLDDLGFKQGNIVWNSKITMSNVVLNIAHKNSGYDIYKEGKFCYMDTWFRLDVQSGDALYSELSGLIGTLPKEFWPKSPVISPVGNLINSSNNYSVEMVYIYIVEDGRILVDKRFGYNLGGISATQRNKYLHFGWETN